ncbi:MoaD/ThiS family protein [Zhihengliuella halotolerans]|uniref:Molybdopterin converting factor small subunit n=1 Tax=Zhihengliuella halotolerans TaxID=370736 RepID=A0A4Q8ACS7_9MICC|nr:MoaD/ThiS family protein [Zhihengliuella halotolerans]RZU61884.1 molybdopterin converting factor small subunit [Zhihengliuella halotolerans]
MLIRYFAAAAAAAGRTEEKLDASSLPSPTLAAVIERLAALHPAAAPEPGQLGRAPSLERVLSRSTFLVNEVSERDPARTLADGDVVDVLPPFAGG